MEIYNKIYNIYENVYFLLKYSLLVQYLDTDFEVSKLLNTKSSYYKNLKKKVNFNKVQSITNVTYKVDFKLKRLLLSLFIGFRGNQPKYRQPETDTV